MDNKCRFSVSTTPGHISIQIERFWSQRAFYAFNIVVRPADDNGRSGSSSVVKIASITWEQYIGGNRISEEQAKKDVIILSIGHLGCDFDALPEYDRGEFS